MYVEVVTVSGSNPVKIEAREGPLSGAVQCALVNNIPLLASRSMLGVTTLSLWVMHDAQSLGRRWRSSRYWALTFPSQIWAPPLPSIATVVLRVLPLVVYLFSYF